MARHREKTHVQRKSQGEKERTVGSGDRLSCRCRIASGKNTEERPPNEREFGTTKKSGNLDPSTTVVKKGSHDRD